MRIIFARFRNPMLNMAYCAKPVADLSLTDVNGKTGDPSRNKKRETAPIR
ncbi:hypothetical protein KB559_21380 [Paenibacillus sp. Marseille-P2973]|nr:hypothetical protein [Paenibacillus sp. Marseille-P2973]MBQ4901401.1 hypothetical protein [Paenibacillus sp. Marseille-P2973]